MNSILIALATIANAAIAYYRHTPQTRRSCSSWPAQGRGRRRPAERGPGAERQNQGFVQAKKAPGYEH